MRELATAALACLLCAPLGAQYRLNKVAQIAYPTCLAVADDGRIFVTERRTGRIRIFDTKTGKLLTAPFASLGATVSSGERGLLGIALDPQWPKLRFVYVFQHYLKGFRTVARVVRFRAVGNLGTSAKTILDDIPSNGNHNGGVLAFGPDGKLYLPIGDLGRTLNAQDKTATNWGGKIHRFNADGTIPANNPFGAKNSHWCLGIRNSFGLAFHPVTGGLYESENGPTSSDELQLIRAGGNFGWPQELGNQGKPGFDKPLRVWTPVIAACGVDFYYGSAYPKNAVHEVWVCDYRSHSVRALVLAGNPANSFVSERKIVSITRPTDVALATDGKMYVASHASLGGLYRVDWGGTAPKLPDLSTAGTPKTGNSIVVTHRGKPGRIVLVLVGTLVRPTTTPFGSLEVLPLASLASGIVPVSSVLSTLVGIPNTAAARGTMVSAQSLELDLSLTGALSDRVDVTVR